MNECIKKNERWIWNEREIMLWMSNHRKENTDIGKKLPLDANNPAHGSLLRVNSPSHGIFSFIFFCLLEYFLNNFFLFQSFPWEKCILFPNHFLNHKEDMESYYAFRTYLFESFIGLDLPYGWIPFHHWDILWANLCIDEAFPRFCSYLQDS